MSLRAIDLNLLPTLQALLRERSVSRAADALALSQPAVSAALRRLRVAFDDELLVRVGGRMELTARAIALAAQVEANCESLENLFAKPTLDPGQMRRTFVIASPDQASFLLAPHWLRTIERLAPGVRLRFVDLGEQTAQRLTARDVDFAIMPSFFMEDLPPAPLRFQSMYQDRSVAMFRTGHPLARYKTLSQRALSAYHMVGFHPGYDRIERKRRSALLGSQSLDVILETPQTTLMPFLLLDSEHYGLVSRRMAERIAKIMPLTWRPFAFPTPAIDIGLAWSHVQDSDPAHRWFRETIALAEP